MPIIALPDLPAGGAVEAVGAAGADVSTAEELGITVMGLLNSYSITFIVAFLVVLLLTPIVRRVAIANKIVDHPDIGRKVHRSVTPYLGGVAVFFGLLIAILVSYASPVSSSALYPPVPVSIVIGMVAITFTGLADDVWGWDPRLKIAGQLVAAAALAIEEIGVHVAQGMLQEFFGPPSGTLLEIGSFIIQNGDLYYWIGTALIAIFVLGGCNAANLIDGLDGLLSGVVAIVAVGLAAISIFMVFDPLAPSPVIESFVMATPEEQEAAKSAASVLTGARLTLCFALLGAVLGFLPHNFNPATIFLGDAGSLLLGYMCVVIILMFGELGQTHLVFAGLIVFSVPIMDTVLAIIRRKLSGAPMSEADDQHIHHQLKRTLGGVKRAVFALYGISLAFAVLGVSLAALVMTTQLRVRALYAIALVLFSFVGVIAAKSAHRGRSQPAADAEAPGDAGGTEESHVATDPDAVTAAAKSETGDDSPPPTSKTSASSV